ncbi:MAG TPA: SCP2 sterol-binding domain-containing protein [Gemmatimonadales bacterium]|nr:SCP2 sterol-binding domain-containing protein [Gemmatimonadales bacterium]
MTDFFSPAGIAAWHRRLLTSAQFHEAARGWTGSVLLVERTGTGSLPRATMIELRDGRLTVARSAGDSDRESAEFVLAASPDTWDALADGREDLIPAAIGGKLKLERGNVLKLIPHARAAEAMLRGARRET